MSASASPSTISQYLKQRLHKLKIYGVSDLMQHIDTFKETMGDSVNVKIDGFNNLSILLCSLPPLLTALTCHMERVDASLRFPHERWPEVISMKPRAFLYHNFLKNEECEHLISLAKPNMVRSIVSNATTGVQGVSRSDVDEGGETVFPMSSSGLSVSPKKGDAVLFWNNRPDGSQDPSSLHGER
uniref:Prolyl 4-hydroxylase alpha subunit domain-containing protein n=1 Tax=Brassica campestris TaxID=3711 RepID=M4D584_BRACM